MVNPTYSAEQDSPAVGGFAIVPSDATSFARATRAIYVGTGGDVAVVMYDGTVVTLVGVPSGSFLPVRALRVNDASTDAEDMVGLY